MTLIWPLNQNFNLKNQRNWIKQVLMLSFLIGIFCILLHRPKKLTLVETLLTTIMERTSTSLSQSQKTWGLFLVKDFHKMGWTDLVKMQQCALVLHREKWTKLLPFSASALWIVSMHGWKKCDKWLNAYLVPCFFSHWRTEIHSIIKARLNMPACLLYPIGGS